MEKTLYQTIVILFLIAIIYIIVNKPKEYENTQNLKEYENTQNLKEYENTQNLKDSQSDEKIYVVSYDGLRDPLNSWRNRWYYNDYLYDPLNRWYYDDYPIIYNNNNYYYKHHKNHHRKRHYRQDNIVGGRGTTTPIKYLKKNTVINSEIKPPNRRRNHPAGYRFRREHFENIDGDENIIQENMSVEIIDGIPHIDDNY